MKKHPDTVRLDWIEIARAEMPDGQYPIRWDTGSRSGCLLAVCLIAAESW